jgi:hypothetical protein
VELTVGVEQASPASIAFVHLTRGYSMQGTAQANARVVVVVVVVVVEVVDVVDVVVVLVVVVEVVVVDVVVVIVLVVVEVEVVEVDDVFVDVKEVVLVVRVVLVSFGPRISKNIMKQAQKTVSFSNV